MNPKGSDTADAIETVDMCDRQLMLDPYRGYSKVRERAPVARGVLPPVRPVWLVTRYEDVKTVLSDPRFVVNPESVQGLGDQSLSEPVLRADETPAEYVKYRVSRMGQFDGAGHARLRASVSRVYSAERVASLRPRVEEIAAWLLNRLPDIAEDGIVDLLAHFAGPLADAVLGELLGIPKDDCQRWWEWCLEVKQPDLTLEEKAAAWHRLVSYAQELFKCRRAGNGATDGDDLISAMIKAPDLSETETISMMLMEHNAHRESAYLICNATVTLLTHPAQLSLLRENPDLLPRAVDELFRFCGPMSVARLRHAAEDVTVGGVLIRKGEAVWPALAGANYDPRTFDDPDQLNVNRAPDGRRDPHLAFGSGPHRCLGAGLAQLIAEVVFMALPHRFPGLTLAVDPADLDRRLKPRQWNLLSLPVRLGSARRPTRSSSQTESP